MKYMILLYGSQQDYDALTGKVVPGKPAWAPEDFAAMGTFMAEFSKDLTESGELVETRGLTAPAAARRRRGDRAARTHAAHRCPAGAQPPAAALPPGPRRPAGQRLGPGGRPAGEG
jgi:hypothetical protein